MPNVVENLSETRSGGALDCAVKVVKAAKHSTLARTLMLPIMSVRFEMRDRAYAGSADSAFIHSLGNTCRGRRCFIVGNGPSLRTSDLDALTNEVTFAANGIVNLFSETAWRPTYYLAVDREYIMHEASTFPSLGLDRIFVDTTPFSSKLRGTEGITLLNKRPKYFSPRKYTTHNIAFSTRPDLWVNEGYTVTYTALQLALWMGFSDIYLIGMDHAFRRVAHEDGTVEDVAGVRDHAYEDASGTHVNPQFRDGVETAYWLARYEAEARSVHIYNATRGGSLEVFERTDFEALTALFRLN